MRLLQAAGAAVLCAMAAWAQTKQVAKTRAGAQAEISSSTTSVSRADLERRGIEADWRMYNGDYTGRRYSSLAQVTRENANALVPQWVFHSRNAGILEVTPVVISGVMYVTGSNDAYALDATTGKTLWHHTRSVTQGLIDDASGHINRGVAVLGTRIYMETDNAHLICLDARSGNQIWDVPYAFDNRNYGATSAPMAIRDKILVGTSGGDDGVRGFVAAFDAQTGKEVWRFWTVPEPGQPGSETWPTGGKYKDAWKNGGGTTWMPGTFDPELNTIYWTTSNPSPDFDGTARLGDNLYTSSVIALDPDTGKLKWHFQFTPHDVNDYDATETPVLVDMNFKGEPRKLMLQANRNGFMYVLDRTTGRYLQSKQFALTQNWAKGIDENGRPVRTDLEPTKQGTRMCPSYAGGTNWYSPTWNEVTHLFYFLSLDDCSVFKAESQDFEEGKTFYSTGAAHMPDENARKFLMAYDPVKNDFAWIQPQTGVGRSSGGVMSTASGIVAYGDDAEEFEVVDAQTGEPLYHFNMGQPAHASPMSYAVKGRQYFAIAAGNDLFTFALPAGKP